MIKADVEDEKIDVWIRTGKGALEPLIFDGALIDGRSCPHSRDRTCLRKLLAGCH